MKEQIINILKVRTLLESKKEVKMPFSVAFKISDFLMASERVANTYQQELAKLIVEYGEKDESGAYAMSEDGMSPLLKKETAEEGISKFIELQLTKVDFPEILFTEKEVQNLMEMTTVEEITSIKNFIEKEV